MVTETTKSAIWDSLLEAARISRYYSDLTDIHLKRRYWRRGISAVIGIFAAIGAGFNYLWFIPVAAILLVSTVVLESFWRDKADKLSLVLDNLTFIEFKCRRLFEKANSDQIDEDKAVLTHELLMDFLLQITQQNYIATNKKLSQKAQDEAFQVESDRYVQTT